jgi:transcriptional regulator with XRE-family HTH domain
MRKIFSDYYRPTNKDFSYLWNQAIFVVDANVYLNLYRYSRETREELLRLLRVLGNRLWAPHQVAAEFLKRRITVIHQQQQKLKELRTHLGETRANVESQVRGIHRDPPVEPRDLLEKLVAAFSDLEEYLNKQENNFALGSNDIENDEVWTAVEELLNDKVGPFYDEEHLKKVEGEGNQRTEKAIPPGFKDEGHGDLILWLQTIDKAKETGKPIILITDDRKEDWWWIENGKTVGPRRELVAEMRNKTGKLFYMYTPDRFMKFASDYFDEKISDEAISEAESFGTSKRFEESTLPESFSPELQDVLRNALAEGFSVEELARESGISETAIKQVLLEPREWPRNEPSLYREHSKAREARKQIVEEAEPADIQEAIDLQQNFEKLGQLLGYLDYISNELTGPSGYDLSPTEAVKVRQSIRRLKSREISNMVRALQDLRKLGLN